MLVETDRTIDAPDAALVLGTLRNAVECIDERILKLISERSLLAREIGLAKRLVGKAVFDAGREEERAAALSGRAEAFDLPPALVRDLYDTLARCGVSAQLSPPPGEPEFVEQPDWLASLPLVRRTFEKAPSVVRVGRAAFGAGRFEIIGGPCAVESLRQIELAADHARACGLRLLRGGIFKPRTSPYDFQGVGLDGLSWLADAAHARGMAVVTEVLEVGHVEAVAERADMLQIGARNMQNAPLLRASARTGKAVLLKRGVAATLKEWLCAAEYILAEGNDKVVLCERGIRSFEPESRSTLDLSAVPLLRGMTHLPVIVDPSHAAGRHEIIEALSRGAHAVGADGLIVEMHPCRKEARCDARQALSPGQLRKIAARLQNTACAM